MKQPPHQNGPTPTSTPTPDASSTADPDPAPANATINYLKCGPKIGNMAVFSVSWKDAALDRGRRTSDYPLENGGHSLVLSSLQELKQEHRSSLQALQKQNLHLQEHLASQHWMTVGFASVVGVAAIGAVVLRSAPSAPALASFVSPETRHYEPSDNHEEMVSILNPK
jgi:hypothetical protein